MIPACSACDKFAMRLMPEAAGTICRPCGPVTMASSRAHWPSMTLPRWKRVCRPSTTSTLANPKSASTSMTSRPDAAMETARLADTVVLPTPPLPPVTAMTLTGREELSSAKASARSGDSLKSRMGAGPAEITGQVTFVSRRRRALTQLKSGAHQPNSFEMRCVQVLRDALTVAYIRDFQVVPEYRGYGGAETGRFIHLGQDACRGLDPHEGADDFIECLAFDLRRKRQQNPCARRPIFQRRQLFDQTHVARPHAGRVDQNQFLGFEPLEHTGQVLGAVCGVHGRTQNTGVGGQLLAGTDSVTVRADERQVLTAMLHAPARGEFGDRCGLAGAGRTHDGRDAAGDAGRIVDDG